MDREDLALAINILEGHGLTSGNNEALAHLYELREQSLTGSNVRTQELAQAGT